MPWRGGAATNTVTTLLRTARGPNSAGWAAATGAQGGRRHKLTAGKPGWWHPGELPAVGLCQGQRAAGAARPAQRAAAAAGERERRGAGAVGGGQRARARLAVGAGEGGAAGGGCAAHGGQPRAAHPGGGGRRQGHAGAQRPSLACGAHPLQPTRQSGPSCAPRHHERRSDSAPAPARRHRPLSGGLHVAALLHRGRLPAAGGR
mmetsp:Transcript_43336/g.108633  ORF Transcript_43336/g.108633 Transcript_43336/m.108633 type:complete len:204 (-) Transcript_43336:298-909(-)